MTSLPLPEQSAATRGAALRTRVRAYVEQQSARGATAHLADTTLAAGGARKAVAAALAALTRDGELQRLPGRAGWVAASVPSAAFRPVTLADLLALAVAHTDPTFSPPKGRKALDINREIAVLSPAQLADIERMARMVATRFPGAYGSMARITGTALCWDATARAGRGEWALVGLARTYARDVHREKHEARGQGPWTPALAEESVTKHVGAAQNLMYLAATHGRVLRAPAPPSADGAPFAPTWAHPMTAVVRWMGLHHSGNTLRARTGTRLLASYATRCGGLTLADTDWLAVRDQILADAAAGRVPRFRVEAARWVWRWFVARFGRRLALPPAWEWSVRTADPVTLVPAAALLAAADAAARLEERDFSGWLLPDGRPAVGLVEGAFGLRRWAGWSTLDSLQLHLALPPLPDRAWAWDSAFGARSKGAAPRAVSSETLRTRFTMFAYLAGYAAKERGVDWADPATRGLLEFAQPGFLDDFVRWTQTLGADPRGSRAAQLSQRVRTVAWLINGFLAAEARRQQDAALEADLRQRYTEAEHLAGRLPVPKHQDRRQVAAQVLATANGWKGADGIDGIKKLARLVGCLEDDLVQCAGGRSVAEQVAALAEGGFTPGAAWGKALRLMLVLLMAERVPLRANTFAQLELAEWVHAPVGPEQHRLAARGALPLWAGQLGLDIPSAKMKSKRPFPGRFIQPDQVTTAEQPGHAVVEARLRRDLWQLWFMPGGGRDVCRTVNGVVQDVPWLFPDAVGDEYGAKRGRPAPTRGDRAKGRKRAAGLRGRWTRARLSAAFRRAVVQHAAALAIDLPSLERIAGALRFHTVRRLFGSYWGPRNLLVCSRLLDHTKVTLTAEIYCGQDVRTMALDLGT